MRRYRAFILASIVLPSTAALAQSQPAASAETPAADTAHIEDIVVTATRREERLQQVPIAVTALTSQALVQAGITNQMQLQAQTPGLVLNRQVGGLTPFIRGVGSNDATAGQEAGVATYIDGVYQANTYSTAVDFNNIERIEVLKGPQGTLFGRNATGGAIQIVTKDPSHVASIEGSASYGNFNTFIGKAYGTTGLTDTLAADFSVVYHNQADGFGHNLVTGQDIYKQKSIGLRSKWLWTPTDSTKITIAGDYSHWKNNEGLYDQMLPGTYSGKTLVTYTGNFWDGTSGVPYLKGKTWAASGKIEQSLGNVDLVSITAYRATDVHYYFDEDGVIDDRLLGNAFSLEVNGNHRYRSFTQELQLLSAPGSPIRWIIGGFFMHDNAGGGDPAGIALTGTGVGAPYPTMLAIVDRIKTNAFAVFGEATAHLAPRTELTLGLRWSKDIHHLGGETKLYTLTSGPVQTGIYPIPAQPDLVLPVQKVKAAFSDPTWRIVLTQHLNDNSMVYASYNRGFKSGNLSSLATGFSPAPPAFKPEKVDAFELGSKNDLLDHHLRINASAFYEIYKGLQLPSVGTTASTIFNTINAAKAHISGAELEGQIVPVSGLTLGYGLAYLHAKFVSFPGAQCYVPNAPGVPGISGGGATVILGCDASGNYVPHSPKFTTNATMNYERPISWGTVDLNISWYHSGSYYWTVNNNVKQDPYNRVNARLGWKTEDKKFGLAVFGSNLTNEKMYTYVSASAGGFVFAPNDRRMYGVEGSFKF